MSSEQWSFEQLKQNEGRRKVDNDEKDRESKNMLKNETIDKENTSSR